MIYTAKYKSPIGNILLAAKEECLVGAWIQGQKYYLGSVKEDMKENENLPILRKTKDWLNRYFEGEKPQIHELNLKLEGSDFAKEVWDILKEIPYGETTTYGDIAKKIELKYGKKMSAQAVGGAVGHNPISIIIPCHRVVGKNGTMTGYAGGIEKKIELLKRENAI